MAPTDPRTGEPLTPLSPGRHGIEPELVAADQRRRLLAATAAMLVERGYSRTTITGICDRARVSRATFYEHFDAKLPCIRAALGLARDDLIAAAGGVPRSGDDCADQTGAWLANVLRFAATSPEQAGLVASMVLSSAEPELSADSLALLDQLTAVLEDSSSPAVPDFPRLTERTLLLATFHMISAEIAAGRAAALPDLEPTLRRLIETAVRPSEPRPRARPESTT